MLNTLIRVMMVFLVAFVTPLLYAGWSLDYNETTHLQFMREEEKLARDVYTTLGNHYPNASVFQNITKSEQRHTSAVEGVLEKYGIADPSTDDAVGVYTGEEWGWYFTEKFSQLVDMGKDSLLSALYVGAFIEELDMYDITFCPDVIVETSDEIEDETQCGRNYTDEKAVLRMYQNLLNGSASHLRAFVFNIEKIIGEGNYESQYLLQEDVDRILGRD